MTRANAREVYRALEKVEFMAVADFFLTPTAELADIVLPPPLRFDPQPDTSLEPAEFLHDDQTLETAYRDASRPYGAI